MNSSSPLLLVALPQLEDPNFAKSVILMFHNAEDGALGVVINHYSSLTLEEFAKSKKLYCHRNLETASIFKGGPVEPHHGWLFHTDETIKERKEILPGLFVSGSTDSLKDLLKNGKNPLKLVLGYAGWAPGQLEQEMIRGSWLTLKADVAHILYTDASQIWNQVLKDAGIDPTRLFAGAGIH